MEPSELRPAEQITRQNRLSARLRPSFSNPYQKWIKATLASTGEIIGIAGWMAPGNPIHNTWRITAADFYGWKGTLITEEEFDEMWKGVSPAWHDEVEKADGFRKDVLGDEPHWFLAPLITWPEYQGRGVGKRLLDWAIEQADATDPVTPMYLESAPTAVPVYRHVGFVQQAAEFNYLRRGPLTQTTKAKEGKDDVKQVEVIVEKEVEAAVA
jgi:GNAT superfamily N-acetyltransferase